MKGNVIGFDPDRQTGALTGEDGKRYDFASGDWLGPARPRHGDAVEFVADASRAVQVRLAGPQPAPLSLVQFYISLDGRVSRSQYWLHYVVPVVAVHVVLSMAFGMSRATGSYGAVALLTTLQSLFVLATVWPAVALLVKRIHDRDKTGWLVLLPSAVIVLMLVGVAAGLAAHSLSAAGMLAGIFAVIFATVTIWFFIEFGCMRGTIGPNRFGPDPLAGNRQTAPLTT